MTSDKSICYYHRPQENRWEAKGIGEAGMIALERSAEVYTLRDADIEISFRYVGDRWQHLVSVRDDGGWFPLLASEEGLAADEAPPSPALQELRFEELHDAVFEFQLLGQAAGGVYSAAVRFDGAARAIDFDVCARGRSAENSLCTVSRYVVGRGDETAIVEPHPASLMVLSPQGRGVEMAVVPIPDNPPSEFRLLSEIPVRRIAAGCFPVMQSAATGKGISVRWRYRMAVVGRP